MNMYVAFWLFLGIFVHSGECCGPAEIDQPYTITSTAVVTIRHNVIWQLNTGNVLYDSSKSEPNIFPNIYVGTKTKLTILNVTKNDERAVFQHSIGGGAYGKYICALPVYKRANIPNCEPVTLNGAQIKTKCTTAQVFPHANCQFTLQNEGRDKRDISDGTSYITYTHTNPQTGRNEYYSTSCTLQYPVDGLKPGTWIVQVNMYPDQTGVSLDQRTTGQAPNTLMLSIPTVNINSSNCPKGLAGELNTNIRHGYIRQGERASCMCSRPHSGNPPGTIEWSSTQRGNFVYLSQTVDSVTIQINSDDTFTCRSISVLDGSHSDAYTPKYAYGPSSASLTFQRPGPVYLCPNQQTNIGITCQVPANSFNPTTMFTIRDTNSNNLVTKVAGDTEQSKSVNYSFTQSGHHIFTCRVENAVFSDIWSEAPASTIEVFAPPNIPPSFQVTGQYVIADSSETWVNQGSDFSVSCFPGKAYPAVKSVTVTCGQESSSSGHLSVSGVRADVLMCQCAVDHETKGHCNDLNLTKDITLQIAYGPREVRISFADDRLHERQNEPLNLCSSEGVDVTVICAVKQSDVRPGLTTSSFTLTKPNTFTIIQQSYLDVSEGGDYKSVNKLKVISGGSHSLVCEARNPKFSDIKQTQSVTIEIREPPRKPPMISVRSSQNGDILVEGDDVTVTCDVTGGYPPVQSVILKCGQDQSVTSNQTSATLTLNEIGLSYNDTKCICQATHITGCYDLKGVYPLTILMAKQSGVREHEDSLLLITKAELAGVVIGSIVGTLVLVVVILLVVFIVRKEKAKRKNRSRDTAYDEIERPKTPPYQNVRSVDPNHPYQTINPPDQASASNIESVNHETDHTYRNQIFDDNAEPDPNAYSEILN